MRVLIPRGGSWGDDVAQRVTDAGFEPLILPLVQLSPADDQQQLETMLGHLADGRFDWLIVTSQSTVRVLPRVPASVSVAAVGTVTATALRERGVPVAFIPTKQSAAGLVDEWPIREGRVLWPHAEGAKPTIADGLRQHGMQVSEVVAYRTTPVFRSADQLIEAVETGAMPVIDADALRQQDELQAAGQDGDSGVLTAIEPAETPIDAVLVTSGSVAKQVARLGLAPGTRIIAIGEQTAEDCSRSGLHVAAIAKHPNAAGLVDALVAAASAA